MRAARASGTTTKSTLRPSFDRLPSFRAIISSAVRGPDLPGHDQILEADFLTAGRADGLRPQPLAAAVGELQLRRGSPVWAVSIAPFLEGDQHREQVAAGLGQ